MNPFRPRRERRRIHWPDLERVLQATPGWRREGRELHGPCPLCGGHRRCWARPGDSADILFQCRKCDASFDDLLTAVGLRNRGDGTVREPETYRPQTTRSSKAMDHLVALWALGEPTEAGTPRGALSRAGGPGARRYRLRSDGAVQPSGRSASAYVRCQPTPPGHCYTGSRPRQTAREPSRRCRSRRSSRMGQSPSPSTRRPNENQPRKRPNVGGSLMTGRALVVHHGNGSGRAHLVEGPIDALAVAQLLGVETLRGTGDTVNRRTGNVRVLGGNREQLPRTRHVVDRRRRGGVPRGHSARSSASASRTRGGAAGGA